MDDLASFTGATPLTEYISDLTPEEALGSASKSTISKEQTLILGGLGNRTKIEARQEYLRLRI
jgi:hypothetical protein